MTRQIDLAELKRWEDQGATWRTLELRDERALVELCTCYGEGIDTVESRDPALIAALRAHHPD